MDLCGGHLELQAGRVGNEGPWDDLGVRQGQGDEMEAHIEDGGTLAPLGSGGGGGGGKSGEIVQQPVKQDLTECLRVKKVLQGGKGRLQVDEGRRGERLG